MDPEVNEYGFVEGVDVSDIQAKKMATPFETEQNQEDSEPEQVVDFDINECQTDFKVREVELKP